MSEVLKGSEPTRLRTIEGTAVDGGQPVLADRVRSLRLAKPAHAPRPVAWAPWLLVVILAASTAILSARLWSLTSTQAPPAGANAVAAAPAANDSPSQSSAPIPAAPGKPGEVVLEAKGYVIPAHQILVTPKVSGMVIQLFVEEGKRVKKGDILAELEKTDYEADLGAAVARLESQKKNLQELETGFRPQEVDQVRQELAEAEAQLVQLKAEWERNTKLRHNNVLAPKDFEISESAYKAMDRKVARLRLSVQLMVEGPRKERIDAARAAVREAEAEVTKAQWRLDNTTIRAPVSGTILKKNAEEGNIVNPIAFNGSYSLCDLADLADLEVELTIQERDIAKVSRGQRCRVIAEAFPDRVYEGTVSRLMPIADRAKGAVPVRVKLRVPADEEGVYLKPEMGAVVSFLRPGP